MPNRQISVFNPEGTSYVTDEERLNESKRRYDQERADRMLAMEYQNRQGMGRPQPQSAPSAQPKQSVGRDDILAELIRGTPIRGHSMVNGGLVDNTGRQDRQLEILKNFRGDFADNSGHEINLMDTANKPKMALVDYKNRTSDREWEANQGARDYTNSLLQAKQKDLGLAKFSEANLSPDELMQWNMAKERGLEDQFMAGWNENNTGNADMLESEMYGNNPAYIQRKSDERQEAMGERELNRTLRTNIAQSPNASRGARIDALSSMGVDPELANTSVDMSANGQKIGQYIDANGKIVNPSINALIEQIQGYAGDWANPVWSESNKAGAQDAVSQILSQIDTTGMSQGDMNRLQTAISDKVGSSADSWSLGTAEMQRLLKQKILEDFTRRPR